MRMLRFCNSKDKFYRQKSSIIVNIYLLLPGVTVCIDSQISVWTRPRILLLPLPDAFGKGVRANFPLIQHSQVTHWPQFFILIPVASPFSVKSLIAVVFENNFIAFLRQYLMDNKLEHRARRLFLFQRQYLWLLQTL